MRGLALQCFAFCALGVPGCITFDPIDRASLQLDLTKADMQPDGSGNMMSSGSGAATTCTSAEECPSGFCVDGVCCNEACTDACVRCDGEGTKGTCQNVALTPSGVHPACDTSHPTCGGTCDGSSRVCVYPTASVRCGSSCDGVCSGAGACTVVGDCPNHFACLGTGCATSCTTQADCAPNFECAAPNCVRTPEPDCLNGTDDNGDGLADCQDPTCISQVECVPAPTGSDKLGVRITSGSCPPQYTATTETYYTNISNGACTGCACNSTCTQTVRYKTVASANCSNVVNTRSVSRTGDGAGDLCAAISSINTSQGNTILDGTGTLTCSGSGTAVAPATTSTTHTFCVAKTSATCDASHLCVAKQANTSCTHTTAGVCPSDYPTSTGTYFGSVTNATCNSCGASACTPLGTCSVGSTGYFSVGSCTGATQAFSTTCTAIPGGGLSASSMTVNLSLSNANLCNLNTTINASGSDPSSICCL